MSRGSFGKLNGKAFFGLGQRQCFMDYLICHYYYFLMQWLMARLSLILLLLKFNDKREIWHDQHHGGFVHNLKLIIGFNLKSGKSLSTVTSSPRPQSRQQFHVDSRLTSHGVRADPRNQQMRKQTRDVQGDVQRPTMGGARNLKKWFNWSSFPCVL